jgi:hypothetical protein
LNFFFKKIQESRGPHASAGAIRNSCFSRNRTQGKKGGCDRGEWDSTRIIKGSQVCGGGGYDYAIFYSSAAPRSAKGIRDDFER